VKNTRRISTFQAKSLHPVTPDEGPSLETSKFSLYFSGSCIPTNESLFILLTLPTLTQIVQDYITSIVRLHLSTREFLHYSCALIPLVSCVPWMRARRNRKHLSARQDEFCTIVKLEQSHFVFTREVWNRTIWSQLTTRIPVWTNETWLICAELKTRL
jgi:hypothetical protein